jgi:hypothetical protein
MERRQFINTSLAGLGALLVPSVASLGHAGEFSQSWAPKPGEVFPYRAWSFSVNSYDWPLLEANVSAALHRFPDYGINTFELHDYSVGHRGLVDAAVTYRFLPQLAAKETLTYRGEVCGRRQKSRDYERLRDLSRKVKNKGLKLNFWYHVLRDAPAELFSLYPEARNLDSGFCWTYLTDLLGEFFERVPEVDRLVLTSLHETPSVLHSAGPEKGEERLLKLYKTIYEACRRAGKELVIRDFIVRYEDFLLFWKILARLPDDVYIMTKEVLADWIHMGMPLNPFIQRYAGRKLIVEFDLYGEYWGRLDMPACYPDYLHRQIRMIKAQGALGAVGRVIHDDRRSHTFETVFDSPNDLNCFAFGKFLSRPLPWLGPGMFTDPREVAGRWGWDLDAFDKSVWLEWGRRRYGPQAAIPVMRALSRTGQIVSLTTEVGGRGFQEHSYVPGVRSASFLWEPFVKQVQTLGMDFLRDEKLQAHRTTQLCLEEIHSARRMLTAKDYDQLVTLFEGELLIIRAYRAVLEGYYQIYRAQGRSSRGSLNSASSEMRALAEEIMLRRGSQFFGRLPDTLREFAEFTAAGKAPARATSS